MSHPLLRFYCIFICLLVSACQTIAPAFKDSNSHAHETKQFVWGLSTCQYSLDEGNIQLVTLEDGNWMKDAQGEKVISWSGSSGEWGKGSSPFGTRPRLAHLPKTMRLSYYDYQENRFYQLDAELPQRKLYELFNQRTIDRDTKYGESAPRYEGLAVGIAPQGHIVVWVNGGGGDEQIELATFQAQPVPDMTIERYNATNPNGAISTDRWRKLSVSRALKPETIAKLKSGWLPTSSDYLQQRTKYPWRYRMSGNGHLLEFTDVRGNQERFYVGPWMLSPYQSEVTPRGVPQKTYMWFKDLQGNFHVFEMHFYTQYRVAGEPDLTAIWQAYEKLFPGRRVQDNDHPVRERDMATLDIHVSDNLKVYTATLIKGDQRITLPIGNTAMVDVEPFAHFPGEPTPSAALIKSFQDGPSSAAP